VENLRLQVEPVADARLTGVSGRTGFVRVETVLRFTTMAGGTANVRGRFAAFSDPAASDYSILGRNVLDNFDLIVGWQRGPIRLLAPCHSYQIVSV
jgi:hypothetical protein